MKENRKPIEPSLFLCNGTSGAGLSTAIESITKLGVSKPATQFTTRALRPNEKRGDQFYSVSAETLNKIPAQIGLIGENYGNTYGFFYPGIHKMHRILEKQNIILDALNTREEWRVVLGENTKIVTIYFAPASPNLSIQRIIDRAKQTGANLSKEELTTRIMGNAQNIGRIREFDYWLDTTDLDTVLPSLQSIIDHHGFGSDIQPLAISVTTNPNLIGDLIRNYSLNQLEEFGGTLKKSYNLD
ncbi:MAG TPA: hypothetical protein VKC54_01860 [Patescibacteria group bacterium]|nr:hypothetical protein [Patescibacteria group bacterium]